MRNIIFYILCFVGFFMSSCVKDSLNDCKEPLHRLGLYFTYTANGQANVVNQYIHQATVYVYNKADNSLYKSYKVMEHQIEGDNGYYLDLPAGDYVLMAMGNLTHKTSVSNISDLASVRFAFSTRSAVNDQVLNDPLYISRLDLTVDQNTPDDLDLEMIFKSAHIKFDVHVSGLSAIPDFYVSNLIQEIDMNLTPLTNATNVFYPGFTVDNTHQTIQTEFNTLRILLDHNVSLTVSPTSGDPFTLSLNDYVTQHLPHVSFSQEEIYIPILIDFQGLEVIAKVPSWITLPSIPGVE